MKKSGSSKKKSSSVASSSASKETRAAILDNLDNPDEKLRMEACSSIASKFEPQLGENVELERTIQKDILRLSKDGMFPLLIKCARDPQHPIVRLSAIGALRNISITGGEKAIALMQQSDAWSALIAAIELGDSKMAEMDLALKRESLRVMDTLCENSSAVAERRLPDSLPQLLGPCFASPKHVDVLEAASKLMFRATQNNLPLAQAMASTDTGKQIGAKLEELASFAPDKPVLASAYALGALVHLCLVSKLNTLPQLAKQWVVNVKRDLFSQENSNLPQIANEDDQVLRDAVDLQENDMEEDGKPKMESTLLKQWLDRVQAQTIVFEVFTELLRAENASQGCIAVLQNENWLQTCLQFTCALWNRESVGPNVLLLPVAGLQQAAAECASAAADTGSALPPNVYFTLVQIMGQITLQRETNERMIAFANLLLSISLSAPVAAPQVLQDQLQMIQTQCPVVPVRALMAHVLAKLNAPLAQIATMLLKSAKEDPSLVVVSEVIDVLIDLFSADEAQPVLTQLQGDEVFQAYCSKFERRFNEWKRSNNDEAAEEESAAEKLHEVRENAMGFVQWRQSLK